MKNVPVFRQNNPFSNPFNQLPVKIIWQIYVSVALLFHSSPRNILTWASSWLSSWLCRWFASFFSSRSNSSKGEARLVSKYTLLITGTEAWRTNSLRNFIYYLSLSHKGPNLCVTLTQNTPKDTTPCLVFPVNTTSLGGAGVESGDSSAAIDWFLRGGLRGVHESG